MQGQTWFARQSNGYMLMFTVRMASPSSPRIAGYVQSSQSDGYANQVGSQYLSGGLGTNSGGI